MKKYKVEYKSKPMGCIATPPRKMYIQHMDGGEIRSIETLGRSAEKNCPHCGKLWTEHK